MCPCHTSWWMSTIKHTPTLSDCLNVSKTCPLHHTSPPYIVPKWSWPICTDMKSFMIHDSPDGCRRLDQGVCHKSYVICLSLECQGEMSYAFSNDYNVLCHTKMPCVVSTVSNQDFMSCILLGLQSNYLKWTCSPKWSMQRSYGIFLLSSWSHSPMFHKSNCFRFRRYLGSKHHVSQDLWWMTHECTTLILPKAKSNFRVIMSWLENIQVFMKILPHKSHFACLLHSVQIICIVQIIMWYLLPRLYLCFRYLLVKCAKWWSHVREMAIAIWKGSGNKVFLNS